MFSLPITAWDLVAYSREHSPISCQIPKENLLKWTETRHFLRIFDMARQAYPSVFWCSQDHSRLIGTVSDDFWIFGCTQDTSRLCDWFLPGHWASTLSVTFEGFSIRPLRTFSGVLRIILGWYKLCLMISKAVGSIREYFWVMRLLTSISRSTKISPELQCASQV